MHTILIAEDDKTVRDNLYDLLTMEGYKCIQTANGEEALVMIEERKPDLILSDIMMPKLDGIGLYKTLSKRGMLSNTPFIFLTAKSDYHSVRNGMNLGADDYIAKPFNSSELLDAVKTRIKKRIQVQTKFDELRNSIIKYVPHELKTPLISIMGYSSMLLEDYEEQMNEEMKAYIKSVYESGKRLNRTIDKFLLYAELRSIRSLDEISLQENTENDLNDIIDGIMLKMHKVIVNGNKLVRKVTEIKPGMNMKFLEIMLTELIENAFKFSSNSTDVIVTAYQKENKAVLIVQNSGKPFRVEDRRNIGPFIQFDKEMEQQQGNGLGLAITCRILELADGRLKIDSVENTTTVIMELPAEA